MIGPLGTWEILLIVAIIALLFGGKKLPQLGKGLGEGIMNFKNSLLNSTKDDKEGNGSEKNDKSDNEKGN